ncbi:MAG TPA: bifunctional demethylmenaquinone methyltransferase/2-methoxy-6-polyprenyl-1,4-benzoquinol methylase UbiE [Candidatus Sphingobacterium stercoripullorum]|nr:bifunctional demethylmenaquinone methyltransferase/2-methoxy-6-polyprenyl-1,4-benzoquinol methylase UbiE [Candidatus Sphingobacterium stercoripullorum]
MAEQTNTIKPYKERSEDKKTQVASMFDNISPTYDFLNHFLSFGIDIIWRKKAIASLKELQPQLMLDVATGTGDFAFEALKRLDPKKIIGVDISSGMLEVAQEKIEKRNLQDRFEVQLGDSEHLPFQQDTFDAVTVAFGVRNFENLSAGLAGIHKVLRPGGKAVILEFSNPKNFPIKQLYGFYSNAILPTIGKLFSKDSSAYTYLPDSIEQFPDGKEFEKILQSVGFTNTKVRPQTFGICTIYEGEKI